MRFTHTSFIASMTGLVLLFSINSLSVQAAPDTMEQSGSVSVKGSSTTNPVDPENPGTIVDPGKSPSTTGPLRIDYVSALDFGESKITKGARRYNARAQQFFGDTGPRGSYIQITDQQADSSGWTLQVKQEKQFTNPIIQNVEEQELKGAVLSLDKGWANSSSISEAPTVTRETIALNSIGSAYEVATARKNSGKGIWTITFGASESNTNNQPHTLTPVVDASHKPIIDQTYNKPVYSNSAITLTVPETTVIHPVEYQTEITWILAKLP
ncbi:WxL domain-containing protein [Enterococcus wangshanyuanii]|uniref:Cell surface protein n=1 Tax=Enterococcus wangshanyuanii TaxID=2005703 RepID=A0ABQ1NJQ7_9ENTE|nr:WxL domain-containing protein [Enterococcus wangshanyuanii]GGC76876.1 cell surface protein [Enterococcus wangshanyuanii]